MKKFFAALSAVTMLLAAAGVSYAADEPMARKIIVFKEGARGLARQADAVRGAGGLFIKHLPLINAVAAALPQRALAALYRDADVLRVDDDIVVTALATQPPETLPWGVDRVEADLVWGGAQGAMSVSATPQATGEFVKVAVIDTGIDLTHPDLMQNVKGNVNTIRPTRSGNDDNGHGSHVAGIIAGVDNTIGVIGVAPRASLYAVKVLGSNGSGWLSDIIEGIDWSIANGMQVINMSLGSTAGNQSFHDAVIRAYNAGITVVCAAGNNGTSGVTYPAKYPETIAVAAMNQDGTIASYSSVGPEVTITAPGTSVFSTYKSGTYKTLSGTSMASPHVAAAAALLIQKYGKLTPDQVKQHLKGTAVNLGFAANKQGAGLLDAEQAITVAP